mmetsp:Transcript_39294/g.78508  ORF Transcript_39294/g.78508 Transcript_39294/m.78508 type:complete len:1413 (-) Transcript_39294:686-4924(-)
MHVLPDELKDGPNQSGHLEAWAKSKLEGQASSSASSQPLTRHMSGSSSQESSAIAPIISDILGASSSAHTSATAAGTLTLEGSVGSSAAHSDPPPTVAPHSSPVISAAGSGSTATAQSTWTCMSCGTVNEADANACQGIGDDKRPCNSTRRYGERPAGGTRNRGSSLHSSLLQEEAEDVAASGAKTHSGAKQVCTSCHGDAGDGRNAKWKSDGLCVACRKSATEESSTAEPSLTPGAVASGAAAPQNAQHVQVDQSAVSKRVDPDRKHPSLKSISKPHFEAVLAMRLVTTNHVSWNDVVGVDNIRKHIEDSVVWPLRRPDLYTGLTKAPKGMLLFGPPGTGKTMVAKVVAAQAGFHFFNVKCSDIENKYHGESEKLITALFAVANLCPPGSIIFLDECDSLLRKADGDDASHVSKTLNQFKASWDGVESKAGQGSVFVLGATNHPWDLDSAILRPGRMDFKVLVELPDRTARCRILHRKLQDNKWDSKGCETLVLDATEGFSGADLEALCKEAAMGPVREAQKQPMGTPLRAIVASDFERAIRNTPRSVDDAEVRKHREWRDWRSSGGGGSGTSGGGGGGDGGGGGGNGGTGGGSSSAGGGGGGSACGGGAGGSSESNAGGSGSVERKDSGRGGDCGSSSDGARGGARVSRGGDGGGGTSGSGCDGGGGGSGGGGGGGNSSPAPQTQAATDSLSLRSVGSLDDHLLSARCIAGESLPVQVGSTGPDYLFTVQNGLLRKMETQCTLSFGGVSYTTTRIEWHLPCAVMQAIEADIQEARKNPRTGVPPFTAKVKKVAAAVQPDGEWASTGLVQYQLPATALNALVGAIDQWLPVTASSSIAQAKQALHQHFRPVQIDFAPKSDPKRSEADHDAKQMTRAKVFWGRYGYGQTECKNGLCSPAPLQQEGPCPKCGHVPDVDTKCCNDIPHDVRAVAQSLMDATVDGNPLCKLRSINSALLNIYEKRVGPTSMLGQHFDSPHHFNRPIYTIRLLRPAMLSFVTGGLMTVYGAKDEPLKPNRSNFPIYFEVPLLPGCLTEMDGFSARALEHAVLPGDEPGRTVSLVLRNIHDSLLTKNVSGDDWLENNSIRRTPASGGDITSPQSRQSATAPDTQADRAEQAFLTLVQEYMRNGIDVVTRGHDDILGGEKRETIYERVPSSADYFEKHDIYVGTTGGGNWTLKHASTSATMASQRTETRYLLVCPKSASPDASKPKPASLAGYVNTLDKPWPVPESGKECLVRSPAATLAALRWPDYQFVQQKGATSVQIQSLVAKVVGLAVAPRLANRITHAAEGASVARHGANLTQLVVDFSGGGGFVLGAIEVLKPQLKRIDITDRDAEMVDNCEHNIKRLMGAAFDVRSHTQDVALTADKDRKVLQYSPGKGTLVQTSPPCALSCKIGLFQHLLTPSRLCATAS